MSTVLITGSSGLVGSACVRRFCANGWRVVGIDNNGRRQYFGEDGDTLGNSIRLQEECPGYLHLFCDVTDALAVADIMAQHSPNLVIHAAAQPSHDYATRDPLADFEINAVGTANVLEATRANGRVPFIFLSTNKVYGDAPNRAVLQEKATRWEMPLLPHGFDEETTPIDQSRHSIFGASKLAADILVQEYGRTYGMPTVCFRCGCLTGGDHAGAELHGFLAYLAKCIREDRLYTVYGYDGKQVRDQLHADDVASACELFAANPRVAAVYNLGGGRENSISILEAITKLEDMTGRILRWRYEPRPRGGDHVCWYTNTAKFRRDYPSWRITRGVASILEELCNLETASA